MFTAADTTTQLRNRLLQIIRVSIRSDLVCGLHQQLSCHVLRCNLPVGETGFQERGKWADDAVKTTNMNRPKKHPTAALNVQSFEPFPALCHRFVFVGIASQHSWRGD